MCVCVCVGVCVCVLEASLKLACTGKIGFLNSLYTEKTSASVRSFLSATMKQH